MVIVNYMHKNRRRITAQMVFVAGLVLLILGIAFLLGAVTDTSKLSILGSLLFVIIGGIFVILALKFVKHSMYIFLALFFLLVGLFMFLVSLKIIPITLAQGWPLLSVFAGLSLFASGWRHFRVLRYRYFIPSLTFTVLGCVLSVFSFKVVSFSFRRFMLNWWPLLVLLAGLMLVFLSLGPPGDKGGETKP
ncbi:MAG: hypothetical protein LBQ44_05080 [Treponema sp.]|nr:hypothetical protein [Treponema sp.]